MIIEVSTVPPTKTEAKKNPAMLLMLVIGTFLFVASLSFCSLAQSSPNRALLESSHASTQTETGHFGGLKAEERNLAYDNYGNYGDNNADPYGNNNVDTYGNPYTYDNMDPYGTNNGLGTTSGTNSVKRNNHRHSKKKGNKASNGAVIVPASTSSTGTTNNVTPTSTSSTTIVNPSTTTTPATGSTNTGASTNAGSTITQQPTTVSTTNTGSTNTGTPSTTTPTTTTKTTTTTATTAIPGSTNPNVLTYSSNEQCTNGLPAYLSGLTADQKAVILATHNTYRSLVALGNAPGQPGATNMLEMVWDDDLAAKAQTWADACVFDHDTDSSRATTTFSAVGQNIDLQMYSNKQKQIDFTTLVKDWFDEVNLFNGAAAPTNSYQDISGTGHYTQLVWAKSYAVGCGFKVYYDSGMYSYQLTCNYGPAGNWIGEKMYTKGTFNAANCKNGSSSTYQGLCKN